MRKEKKIKIDDQEFTVFELTVEDLLEFKEIPANPMDVTKSMLAKLSDIKWDQILKLAPSEIMLLWEGFKDVNSILFDLEKKTGFFKMIKAEAMKAFSEVYANLSAQGISSPGNTG